MWYKILYWLSISGLGLGLFIVTNQPAQTSTEEMLLQFVGLAVLTISILGLIDTKIRLYHFNKEKQRK